MDLVVILGDQLTPDVAALAATAPHEAVVLMAEVGAETEYAWHHKQKLLLVLSAMRQIFLGWRGLTKGGSEPAIAEHA